MNVLLTGMGGPAGICYAKSLKDYTSISLYGANPGQAPYGEHLVMAMYEIPFANDPHYIERLNEIIATANIDYVIPLVDEELTIIASQIESIDAKVLISPIETLVYTTDKLKAYDKLSEFLPRRIDVANPTFPMLVKPAVGRGGQDVHIISNRSQLQAFDASKYVFQEVLDGPEVTVDTLFDLEGKLLVASPRVRTEVLQGICIKGETFADDELINMISKMAQILQFVGPVNFQFMKRQGKYVLLEINTRSSGGMGVTYNSGLDIPRYSIQLLGGEQVILPTTKLGVYPNIDEIIQRQKDKDINAKKEAVT